MSELQIEHAERIRELEVKVEALTTAVSTMTTKVEELLGIVQQARGARFALVGLGVVSGGLITWVMDAPHKIGAVMQAITK